MRYRGFDNIAEKRNKMILRQDIFLEEREMDAQEHNIEKLDIVAEDLATVEIVLTLIFQVLFFV